MFEFGFDFAEKFANIFASPLCRIAQSPFVVVEYCRECKSLLSPPLVYIILKYVRIRFRFRRQIREYLRLPAIFIEPTLGVLFNEKTSRSKISRDYPFKALFVKLCYNYNYMFFIRLQRVNIIFHICSYLTTVL
jgi:hypothetical protein